MSVVKAIGYNPSVQRFIEKEFKKDNQDHQKARECKRCYTKLYLVVMDNYINELPRDKRLCQECAGLKTDFKPKLNREQAWLR